MFTQSEMKKMGLCSTKRESRLMSEKAYEVYCNTEDLKIYGQIGDPGEETLYTIVDNDVNFYRDLTEDQVRTWFNEWLAEYNREEAEDIAKRIREADKWDADDCEELCQLAGLADEWETADGETFEAVVKKAAEILGVEVF